jgi:hypothetical protein
VARRKRERTIGEALANPRNAEERAFVAEMKALAEQAKKRLPLFDIKPPRYVPPDPARFIPPGYYKALAGIRPSPKRRRLRSQGEENAFNEVEELLSREKLTDRAACMRISANHGLSDEAFYRRFMRAKRRP